MERSSYESHPLGRLEWIRLYGVLFDKEEEADSFYEAELEKFRADYEERKLQCNSSIFQCDKQTEQSVCGNQMIM